MGLETGLNPNPRAKVEVLVDDRLPCAEDGTPLFACSSSADEFWVCIAEKACVPRQHSSFTNPGNWSDSTRRSAAELLNARLHGAVDRRVLWNQLPEFIKD